jgi:hypothetical protein
MSKRKSTVIRVNSADATTTPRSVAKQSGAFRTSDSFQRFEDFARKIANIPKEEIDAIDPLIQKKKKQKPAKQSK